MTEEKSKKAKTPILGRKPFQYTLTKTGEFNHQVCMRKFWKRDNPESRAYSLHPSEKDASYSVVRGWDKYYFKDKNYLADNVIQPVWIGKQTLEALVAASKPIEGDEVFPDRAFPVCLFIEEIK